MAYVWRRFCDYRVADWNGRLVIFEKSNGWLMYPLGEATPPEDLFRLVCEVEACGFKVSSVYDIPPGYFDAYPNAKDFFELKLEEKYFDYLYNAADIFELKGPLLRKKRNHIKHFDSLNPNWTQEPITSANLPEARDFMESLAMPNEIQPLSRVFSFFGELPIDGIILRGESRKIAAAAIMGALNPQMYSVHFEKSDKNSEGAAQKIVSLESSHIIGKGASLMNREQDLGLENLRKAKHSLDPLRLYKRLKLVPLFK